MADDEAKAKAEKLAAAKRRVEQLKKKKAKGSSIQVAEQSESQTAAEAPKQTEEPTIEEPQEAPSSQTPDHKTVPEEATLQREDVAGTRARQQSISIQSKLRSASFKAGSSGPLSPTLLGDGESAPDIHRKQAARIEELEKENKRLRGESSEGEKRWRKAEEELEELRDADDSRPASKAGNGERELAKLRTEIESLTRQNAQLQASTSKPSHGSSRSVSISNAGMDEMQKQLDSKSSTIEAMEMEISNLRAQLARTATGSTAEKEQIAALEEKLARTQRLLDTSQTELGDLKKNLDRTTQKFVKEGSERSAAETKLKTLEREAEEAKALSADLRLKVDGLEKKVVTLTTLHKENDARSQALKKEREKVDKDAAELRIKFGVVENENRRLKEERERMKKHEAVGVDDEAVDELENEGHTRLQTQIRELEAENSELRRGIWKDKRTQLESADHSGVTSPGGKFQDIDLGGMSPTRRRSMAPGVRGFGDYFASVTGALTGQTSHGQDDALLEDDELDFDEDAFRQAQEEAARQRIERIKDVKRGLADWKSWRLDLVELRRATSREDTAEIFEI